MGYKTSELSQSGLYGRIKKLLLSHELSDCNFEVSGKTFQAHKLILGISSPVFEAMFYGPLSTSDGLIVITDIDADIFQLLLNYIYTDNVEILCIEQAFELLYASRKYMLEQLSEVCKEYIKTNLGIDNVIAVLNYPGYMQDEELTSFTTKLFAEHANYLLQENKTLITVSCMKTILESDSMNISEKDLIMHVFEWTKHVCKQNDIPVTFENRKDVLLKNGLFMLLRFYLLSSYDVEEISNDENNLLSCSEVEDIRNIKSKNSENNLCLIQTPRKTLKLQWCLCHRVPLRSVAPVIIDSNNFVLYARVKANKSVFVNSVCIPTRMAPALQFRNNAMKFYSEYICVSIVCESDSSIKKFTNFVKTVEYDSSVDIELPEPCLLKKDVWYKINFIRPQNRFHTYSYVVEHRDRFYKDHRVTFEFEDMSGHAGHSGSFLRGLKFIL